MSQPGKPANPSGLWTEKSQMALAALLICSGGIWLWAQHRWSATTSTANRSADVTVRVQGSLELPKGADTSKLVAHLHLPEIPLDEFRRGKALFEGPEGNFTIEVHLRLAKAPHHFDLSIRDGSDKQLKLSHFKLNEESTEEPGGLLAVCQLERLRLSAQPAVAVSPLQHGRPRNLPRWSGPLPPKLLRNAPPPVIRRGS